MERRSPLRQRLTTRFHIEQQIHHDEFRRRCRRRIALWSHHGLGYRGKPLKQMKSSHQLLTEAANLSRCPSRSSLLQQR